MEPHRAKRIAALLAGLWVGVMVCIAAIAAPTAFAVLERSLAGRVVARVFSQEAHLSLAICVALLLLARRSKEADASPHASVFTTELMLVLGALFCTLFGYFALQPMMEAARAGRAALSFPALHGISVAFFGLKGLLVLALAWRTSRIELKQSAPSKGDSHVA